MIVIENLPNARKSCAIALFLTLSLSAAAAAQEPIPTAIELTVIGAGNHGRPARIDFFYSEGDQGFLWQARVSANSGSVSDGTVNAVFTDAQGLTLMQVTQAVTGPTTAIGTALPGGTLAQAIRARVEYIPATGSNFAASVATLDGFVLESPTQVKVSNDFAAYSRGPYGIMPQITVTTVHNEWVRDGSVHIEVFRHRNAAVVSEWTAPVVDGTAQFGTLPLVPDGTLPAIFELFATYIPTPTSERYAAPQGDGSGFGQAMLSVTPPRQAIIPTSGLAIFAMPAFDETTNTVYVVGGDPIWSQGFSEGGLEVIVIDGDTYAITSRITVPVPGLMGYASAVAVDGARRRLYVAHAIDGSSDSRIFVYDADALSAGPMEVIEAGYGELIAMAVNPNTGWVYAQRQSDGGPDYNEFPLVAVNPTRDQGLPALDLPLPSEPERRMMRGIVIDSASNILYCGTTAIDADPSSSRFHEVLASVSSSCTWGCDWRFSVDRRARRSYLTVEGSPWRFDAMDARRESLTFHQVVSSAEKAPMTFGPRVVPFSTAANPVNGRVYVRMNVCDVEGDFRRTEGSGIAVVDGLTAETIAEWLVPAPNEITCGGVLAINPVNGDLYISAVSSPGDGLQAIHVYRDLAQQETTTSAGTNVTTAFPEAAVTFSSVTGMGTTNVETLPRSSEPLNRPGQFELIGGVAYEITTTATISGPIEVCLNASSITDELTFNNLRLLHGENGVWVDRTSSSNFATGNVCGIVTSLSPFAIARRVTPDYTIKPLYDTTKIFKGGSTVPIKIEVHDALGTNVSAATLPVKAIGVALESSGTAGALVDSGNANPDADFRFDPSLGVGGGYIYNLSTRGLSSGTWEIRFTVGTGPQFFTTRMQVK